MAVTGALLTHMGLSEMTYSDAGSCGGVCTDHTWLRVVGLRRRGEGVEIIRREVVVVNTETMETRRLWERFARKKKREKQD